MAAFGALLLGVAHMIPMVGSGGLAVSLAAIDVTLTRFGTAKSLPEPGKCTTIVCLAVLYYAGSIVENKIGREKPGKEI